MLSFLSGFNQKNVTIFWHKPLLFSIVRAREQGPFPGRKGLPCCRSLLSLGTLGTLLTRLGTPVDWKLSQDKTQESEQAWWSKGGTETRGTIKRGCSAEGLSKQTKKDDGSRNGNMYDGHGSHARRMQLGLLFAIMTKSDFDSWIIKLAIAWKSYIGGISHFYLQSFSERTPIEQTHVQQMTKCMW